MKSGRRPASPTPAGLGQPRAESPGSRAGERTAFKSGTTLQSAGVRLLACWPAKLVGISLGMSLFFAVYFWVLRHPVFPVTVMPLTAVDRWIGFQPAALPLYLSLWIYVVLAPALLVSRRELLRLGLAWIALSAVGLGIFLVWPTIVPLPGIDWSRHPSMAFLKSVDASGNACPSLHVAFAVFTAFWLARLLRQLGAGRLVRALNWLWCLGILYSTVATLQHVALDVLGGAGLGAAVALGSLRGLHPAQPASCPGSGTTQR